MKTFNEKLRELRAERGLTQKQVATALLITVPTLSHWECGYQEPSYKDLLAICRFYEVTADYLIDPKDY